MILYRRFGFDEQDFAFQEGLQVLQRYLDLHVGLGHESGFLSEVVDRTLLEPIAAAEEGAGTKTIRAEDKFQNREKPFDTLARDRVSVREFSSRPIEKDKVCRAIEIALKSPSVCNRQGWRVHWIESKELMSQVLQHQRGFGYPMPEILLSVTVSNTAFLSPLNGTKVSLTVAFFRCRCFTAWNMKALRPCH